MARHTQTIIVPYNADNRTAAGETMIEFNPSIVGDDPVVILTPWLDGQNAPVGYVPTVNAVQVENGVGTLTLLDGNSGPNYFLNVLLVHKQIKDIHGLKAIAETTPKREPGPLTVPGIAVENHVNLLTSYWKGYNRSASYPEVVDGVGDAASGEKFGYVRTNSGNSGPVYFVNNISCQNQQIAHAAQTGIGVRKSGGNNLQIQFETPWDNPPVVFATPGRMMNGVSVNSIETVTKVTTEYFEVSSENFYPFSYVNYLAVTSNPNFHKKHVDDGLAEFLEANPDEAAQIAEHRQAIENTILNGAPPPPGMAKMKRRRAAPLEPVPAYTGPQLFKDAASLAIDTVGLIVSAIGINTAISESIKENAVKSLAAKMASRATDVTPLINGMKKAAGALAEIKSLAGTVLKFVAGLASLGLLKSIVYNLLSALSWYDWVVAGVKLAAQLLVLGGAILASGGFAAAAAAVAWTGRIASLMMASLSVATDIAKIVEDVIGSNKPRTA